MRRTNLILTEQQERDLAEYIIHRQESLIVDNQERIAADKWSWQAYENCRKERESEEGIHETHNLVLPMTSMVVESFISRTEDAILGSDPFFRFSPEGQSDQAKAKQFDSFFRYKLVKQGGLKEILENSIAAVFVQRAAVFKSVLDDQRSRWIDHEARVLYDMTTGEPVTVLDENGEPTFLPEEKIEWIESVTMDENGNEVPAQVLRQDPSVIWQEGRYEVKHYESGLLREETLYKGPKAVLLDYDAFLCPSTATDIQSADITIEKYDRDLPEIQETFLEGRSWMPWEEYVDKLRQRTANPESDLERTEDNKEKLDFDPHTHRVGLIECWLRRDVLGWGTPQEFMVIMDPKEKVVIYYEFLQKICPDLKRPYVAVSITRTKNRWCGPASLVEKLKQYQDYADKQFNLESRRNARHADPTGVWDPSAVEEEPDELEVGDGGLYRKKNGKTAADFVEWCQMPQNLDTKTHQLLEYIVYWVQLWLGVSNISQGDYADLPQNNTKYGIQATLREASKLGRRWIRRVLNGFTELTGKMVKLALDQMDREEVFEHQEGDASVFLTMKPDEIRNLKIDVSLIYTQEMSDMEIRAAQLALETQQKYFATAAPMRPSVKPVMQRILEALDYTETDQLLPDPTPEEIEAYYHEQQLLAMHGQQRAKVE